jgi:hypothetical protein
MTNEQEKGDLIKKALEIVEELSKLDIDDTDDIIDLIESSVKLTKKRLWKLK